jgi:ADP-heptose:LPS heptosyltransferase
MVSPRGVKLCGEIVFRLNGHRPKRSIRKLSDIERLLIVRLDEIGDLVMTTPLLRECRKNLPKAWISLLVKPSIKNIVEMCPYVNEILTYDWEVGRFDRCERACARAHLKRHQRALQLARTGLWNKYFDFAIVPRWAPDFYHAAFVAYLSGASSRLGYSEKNHHDGPKVYEGLDYLMTHVMYNDAPGHEVERTLNAITYLKGTIESSQLELWTSQADERFANEALNVNDSSDHAFIAFGIGAREAKRIWPAANFTELAVWLTENYGAHIVLIGSGPDVSLGQEIERNASHKLINLVGTATLRQTAAVLKRCDLFVGNDSGPMHIAAAMQTPVVEISCHPLTGSPTHQNSPQRFGPWGDSHVVLQPPSPREPCLMACTANEPHCILEIDADQVKNVIHERKK